jgi:hypothetical protein
MAKEKHALKVSRDGEDVELLQAVKAFLLKAGVKGIEGVGPIGPDGTSCKIRLGGKKGSDLPGEIAVSLTSKKSVVLKLHIVEDSKRATLFSGPCPRPWQFSGPLMGGDPIWNKAAGQWGTITFATDAARPVEVVGKTCDNHCLTCSHVLHAEAFGGSNAVSTTRYPGSMTLQWHTNPPDGTKWIDLAGAELKPGVAFTPLEVRGLRTIRGAKQPVPGIRVSKYGATTGLTSGRDLGWAECKIGDDGNDYWVRKVSGFFGAVGDSGAPVLDADRNFLGLIVAGIPGDDDETYYIPVLPKGQPPQGPIPAGAIGDLPYIEIDGL